MCDAEEAGGRRAGGRGGGLPRQGRRSIGAVDGAGDGLDMLFTGLVVEIFDAPFCRVLMASSARVVQSRSPLRRPEAGRRRRSSSSPVPMAAGETRRRSNVRNRRHCLGSMGEGSRIPGTASWSSSLANLGCCVSPVPNAGFCHVFSGQRAVPYFMTSTSAALASRSGRVSEISTLALAFEGDGRMPKRGRGG